MLPFDPKKPLYGFTAKCPHAWRHVHLFMGEPEDLVFFRPRNAEADWLGTFRGDNWASWDVNNRKWYGVKRSLGPLLENSHIWRVFDLPAPREGNQKRWRILWRPDFGYLTPLNVSDPEIRGAYFWPRPAKLNLWKSSTDALVRHFEREWHDPQSDVRQALPWCELSSEERERRAVHWKRGSQQELERLIHAAIQLLPIWGCASSWYKTDKFSITISWDDCGQRFYIGWPLNSPSSPGRERWQKFLARIAEKNQGAYAFPEGTRDDWILPWVTYTRHRSSHRGSECRMQIDPPTQHERLEASLFLRYWLRENAPDLLSDWF